MSEEKIEPSMEEILSSIKRIIADDDRVTTPAAKKAPKKDETPADESIDAEVLELTESEEVAASDEQLMDDSKVADLASSFSALQTLSEPGAAPQIVKSGETSLEGLTRELMKPMLKDWLDANLPQIVEAMVAREISRITKKN